MNVKTGKVDAGSRRSAKSQIQQKKKEKKTDRPVKNAGNGDAATKRSSAVSSKLDRALPAVKKQGDGSPEKNAKSSKTVQAAIPYHAIAPSLDDDAALHRAIAALLKQDEAVISAMLTLCGLPALRRREPGFSGLVAIITGQQVSTASAKAINARILAAFPTVDAQAVMAASDDALRACGLSGPKIRTIRAVSAAVTAGVVDLERLGDLSAEEAHQKLCALHGIGPWTADIFLLFCLGFCDAWPAGDLALQEAARIALGLETRPDARQLAQIGERWRPYRGAAAHLLWAFYGVVKEGKPGNTGGMGEILA